MISEVPFRNTILWFPRTWQIHSQWHLSSPFQVKCGTQHTCRTPEDDGIIPRSGLGLVMMCSIIDKDVTFAFELITQFLCPEEQLAYTIAGL